MKRWRRRARETVTLSSSRELVHAQDGDDVLEVLVALQGALHLARHVEVLLAHDPRVEHGRGRGQRVDRGVDAELHDRALEAHVQSRWPKVVAGAGSV